MHCFLCVVMAATNVTATTVAVTEWMSDPAASSDFDGEFVELFNYGLTPVNVENYVLRDEDIDSFRLPNFAITPGEFLVLTRNKSAFEAEWFNGVTKHNILQYNGFVLANSTDEIFLEDDSNNVIWNIGYANDEASGNSTWLTENDFLNTSWGNQTAPGSNRTGNDPATGTLGYQRQNATIETAAFSSLGGDTASPLVGSYNVVPEPNSAMGTLLGTILLIATSRR